MGKINVYPQQNALFTTWNTRENSRTSTHNSNVRAVGTFVWGSTWIVAFLVSSCALFYSFLLFLSFRFLRFNGCAQLDWLEEDFDVLINFPISFLTALDFSSFFTFHAIKLLIFLCYSGTHIHF